MLAYPGCPKQMSVYWGINATGLVAIKTGSEQRDVTYLVGKTAAFAGVQEESDRNEKKHGKEDHEEYEDRKRERLDTGRDWHDGRHVDHHAQHPTELHTIQLDHTHTSHQHRLESQQKRRSEVKWVGFNVPLNTL